MAAMGRIGRIQSKVSYSLNLFLFAIIIAIIFSVASPASFFSLLNVESIAYAVPEIALMALAISVAMTTAGIDLSVVAVANLSALATIWLSNTLSEAGMNGLLATFVSLAVCAIIGLMAGLLNGYLVCAIRIRPILATLATQQIFVGIAIALSKGEALYGGTDLLNILGVGTFAFVPLVFWVFVCIVVVLHLCMNKTKFGLHAVMLGENARATDYSGISENRVTLQTYMLCGILASAAGVLMAARTGSASAGFGGSYLMLAITIAVLGGANPFGGQRAIFGGAIAAIILQMISSGLNSLGFSSYFYQIVQGVILISVFVVQWEVRSTKNNKRAMRLKRDSDKKVESVG